MLEESTIFLISFISIIFGGLFFIFAIIVAFGDDTDYKGQPNWVAFLRAKLRWMRVRGEVVVVRVSHEDETIECILEKLKDYGSIVRYRVLSVNGNDILIANGYPFFVNIPKTYIEQHLIEDQDPLTLEIEKLTRANV